MACDDCVPTQRRRRQGWTGVYRSTPLMTASWAYDATHYARYRTIDIDHDVMKRRAAPAAAVTTIAYNNTSHWR